MREERSAGRGMKAYRGIQWVKEGILPYPKHGSCVHYEPALCRKEKGAVRHNSVMDNLGKEKIAQLARSYIIKGNFGKKASWHCEVCGMTIKDKHRKKIQQIVEYLNQGGDDDKKLAVLFSGVEIGELVQYSAKKIQLKCSAVCSADYVPPKNRLQ